MSQFPFGKRYSNVNGSGEIAADVPATEIEFDLESLFRAQYQRVARVIARVVRDHARAEELAVDVFLKLSRIPAAQGENAKGWLYRTAVRMGLDELRRETRRIHYEGMVAVVRGARTPEEIHAANEEHERVRRVLGVIARRQAELLVLRSHGMSYTELASALDLNPASIGTLLSRAQQTFRKEYIKRYGKQLD